MKGFFSSFFLLKLKAKNQYSVQNKIKQRLTAPKDFVLMAEFLPKLIK